MDPDIKKLVEETQGLVANFKAENDKALEAGTKEHAETKGKIDKMLEDITANMEAKQKFEERLAVVESMKNSQIPQGQEDKVAQFKKRRVELFNEFARKNDAQLNFASFLKTSGYEEEFKAMSVDSQPDGGFLVLPEIIAPERTRIFETTNMRSVARVIPISSDVLEFPMRDRSRVGASKVGERDSRETTGTRQLSLKRIQTNEIYSYPEITQKMLDDSMIDVMAWIAEDTLEDFSIFENTSFVSGSGEGEARGFLTYPAWATNGTYENEKIEQVASGAAGGFLSDGIIDVQNSLKEGYQPGAKWMIKRASFKKIAQLKDGQGNYLFNRSLDKNVGNPFDLLNAPVMFGNDMPVAAADSLSLAYGDFNKGYMIVDRIGIRTLRDPYTNKPYIGFYSTKRYGGDVYNWEAIKLQKLAVSL